MNKLTHGRVLNYRPDLPDHRDQLYAPPAALAIPTSMDLRAGMPAVMDQGQLSSCSWNALCAVLGFLQLAQMKKVGVIGPEEYSTTTYTPPSRLFGYYNARAYEGMKNSDSGAYIRDGIKAAARMGVCRESLWPYLFSNVFLNPPVEAYQDASSFKISSYQRLTTQADMVACLASGYPFVFGFSVYSSFYKVGADGIVPMPVSGETLYGGHAVTACAYDNSKQVFTIRNSWGTGFGDKGDCYMSYEFVDQYSSDLWTIRY